MRYLLPPLARPFFSLSILFCRACLFLSFAAFSFMAGSSLFGLLFRIKLSFKSVDVGWRTDYL
jgi:hypothetical protein